MNKGKWFAFLSFVLAIAGLKQKTANAEPDDKKKGASGADGKGSADPTDDPVDDDTSGDGDDKKTVKYDSYKKAVGEAKRAKAELKAALERLSSADNDKLAADGKKDELIAKLRGDLDKVGKAHKETLGSFVQTSLDNQIRTLAAEMGCVDLDAAGKLLDLSDIEVDTKTFKADKDALKEALDGLKKSKPYLFNKAGPKINTKTPGGNSSGKKLSELTKDEIWAKLRAL